MLCIQEDLPDVKYTSGKNKYGILQTSNNDWILPPNDGIADSFLANSSLYFGSIVHTEAGLDGQD